VQSYEPKNRNSIYCPVFGQLSATKANKKACGIDNMSIEQFPGYARDKWDTIRESLSDGSYPFRFLT
jgi:hypothetical protein